MYAVIEDRNQQYRVAPGDRVLVPLHADLQPGATVTFDKVCLLGGEGDARIGAPFVEGASVTAVVLGTVKGPKLVIQKYRRRKNQRRRTGFRARYTEVRIDAVNG
jgi:large subunit ribosomal protein L21